MKEFLNTVLDFSPFIIIALIAVINARRERKNPKNKASGTFVNQAEIANQDLMSQVSGIPNSKGIISPLYYSNQQNRDQF